MQPTTGRDFLKVAAQRLTAAEFLFRAGINLDSQYLAGYVVECSLKALILERCGAAEMPEKLARLTAGAKMHRPDVLLGELRDLGISLPLELARRLRHFDWTTDLRYQTGRPRTGETNGVLKTAKQVYDWAAEQLP